LGCLTRFAQVGGVGGERGGGVDAGAYWALIRRRFLPLIVAGVIVGGVLGAVIAAREAGGSIASIRVFGSIERADSVLVSQSTTLAAQRMESYVRLVGTTSLADRIIARLGLDTSPRALASRMSARVEKDTTILDVDVLAPTEIQARRIAEAVPEELAAIVTEVSRQPESDGAAGTRFTIIDGPRTGPNRSLAKTGLSIALGMALGGAIALAIASWLARRAASRSPALIARSTGIPVVGIVPDADSDAGAGAGVQRNDSTSSRRFAYHRLAANLHLLVEPPGRVLLVTGASTGSGASTVARGLADALTERGERAILVDSTFESTGESAEGAPSLADVVAGGEGRSPAAAVLEEAAGLATTRVSMTPEQVQGPGCRRSVHVALRDLADGYDSMVVDTRAALLSADLPTPWALTDAAIVVVVPGRGSVERARASVLALQAAGVGRIGIVMNRVEPHTVPAEQQLSGLVMPTFEDAPEE
jgi:capsular polysaccharide biosynthesis protein/dethiobiotin synthetase